MGFTQSRLIIFFTFILSLALLASAQAFSASAKPSWFPKKSCTDAWSGKDQARFDRRRDKDYSGYLRRLKSSGIDRQSCYKKWAIYVYMAADNDLSPYALWDLTEMEGRFEGGSLAGSTLTSDLIVEADTNDRSGARRLHIFQRDDRRFEPPTKKEAFAGLDLDAISSPVISSIDETGSPPPLKPSHADRLRAFLHWAIRRYPAENTMVILWGHGQGWSAYSDEQAAAPGRHLDGPELLPILSVLPRPPTQTETESARQQRVFGGVLVQPDSKERVTILGLKDILADVVSNTLEGTPIDNYVSDACLMQMAEVATEIAPYTRFISGSAQIQSYLGLPYRRLLYEINSGRYLYQDPTVDRDDFPLRVAQMLPSLTKRALHPTSGSQGKSDPKAIKTFTMSSLHSAGLTGDFAASLERFSAAMVRYLKADPFRALDVAVVTRAAPSFMGGGKDLGAFLGLLRLLLDKERAFTKESDNLRSAIDGLDSSLQATIVSREFGDDYLSDSAQFYLLGYKAFGIWIPTGAREFQERRNDFAQSSLHQSGQWMTWLALILDPK